MSRVLIVGAGLAGLAAALFMGRDGHDVTVLERDGAGPAPDKDTFPMGCRPGIPQAMQSHVFLGRGLKVLRASAPDVADECASSGTTRIDFGSRFPLGDLPGHVEDESLVALGCRRVSFEDTLRRAVVAERRVRLLTQVSVSGLDVDWRPADGEKLRVRGVRVGDERLAADLVVDASGARCGSRRWLVPLGVAPDHEWRGVCGFTYLTQWYRLARGRSFPDQRSVPYAEGRFATVATFPADDGYFSLTYMTPTADPLRMALRDRSRFEDVMRTFDLVRPWLVRGLAEPRGPVIATPAGEDRWTEIQSPDAPKVTGLVAIGDSGLRTNPTRGRGTAFAFVHARLLADLATRAVDDPAGFVCALAERAKAELHPWFRSTVELDRARCARLEAGLTLDHAYDGPVALELAFSLHAQRDSVLHRALARTLNMLTLPADLLAEPDVAERLAAVATTSPAAIDDFLQGPSRRQFVDLVTQ